MRRALAEADESRRINPRARIRPHDLSTDYDDLAALENATFYVRDLTDVLAGAAWGTPVPEIAFTDQLTLELGGKSIELYYTGRNHSDNSIVLLYPERRLLFAVDFIPVNSLPYQNLPDAYPEEWVESLRWIEENLDFDVLVPGHPPLPGTKANVTGVREYLEDLMAAVRAAQDQGLSDNSPEMIEAVRTELEPDSGSWGMVAEWLPLNIEGLLRLWAETGAAGATPAP